MLPNQFMRAFDRCFDHFDNQTDIVLEKSALYCTAQWICHNYQYAEVGRDDVSRIINSTHMRKVLQILYPQNNYKLDIDRLHRLCHQIRKAKMTGDRAKLFYQYYLTCSVTDTSLFAESTNVLPLLRNGPISCTTIHLAMLFSEGKQGTRDIFSLEIPEVFKHHSDTLRNLGVNYEEFERIWDAVHYLDVSRPMRKRQKIEKAMGAYRKFKVPNTMLLQQYAQARHYTPEELRHKINPWEYAQRTLNNVIPEAGMSVDEELFNSAAYQISRELPTDVIHTVFYKGRDDSGIELALARSELKRLISCGKSCLIVNPSPVFLSEIDNLLNCSKPEINVHENSQITFAVEDQVVAFLYAQQFPKYRFVLTEDLDKELVVYELLVILARDQKMAPLWHALSLCQDKAWVFLLIPQTAMTDPSNMLARCLQNNRIHPDWILEVPAVLSKSKPRKKMLVSCRKGVPYEGRAINLLSAVTNDRGDYIALKKEQCTIPCEWLFQGKTLAQMRSAIQTAKDDVGKQARDSQVYDFSREIKICYNIIRRDGAVERARAYYRNIHRPETEINRTKGKRPNSIKTERGLRGKSEDEILHKLEQVALYDEYYDHIATDIKDYYRGHLHELTVKTMWFCCRKELLSRISYDDNWAKQMFCGENQSLSNLISGDCIPDDVVTAVEALCGPNVAGKREWLQLNLIFQVAKEEGLIGNNPLASFVHVVKEENRKKIYLLNAALKKSHFTDEEEKRMVQFLQELVPLPNKKDHAVPRYVLESKWFVGAFSLFAGLPIREICPLLWKDLHCIDGMDEMQLYITKHLNANDEVISNVNYGNKEHYRKVAVDLVLGQMLKLRKQYLMDSLGYTEGALAELPIILENEPSGRGRRKHKMITRSTARKVNNQLLSVAKIQNEIISLLEGDTQFDVNLNAYTNDLFAANFRHKAYHTCGFTVGELCYHAGNKGPDTFSRHYCDYGNDFLQYDMVHKLYRWTYMYDPSNMGESIFFSEQVIQNDCEYTTCRYTKGRAHIGLSLKPNEYAEGTVRVEIECEHGFDGMAVAFGREVCCDE